MPKKWPNLESLLKNEGKAISWRGSNGKIFHLALGNTSNRPQKGAIYNCCLAVYGPLSVCQSGLFSPSTSSLPRVLSVICLYNALSVGREWVSIWTRRKDADLTARLLWSSSEGFRGVTVGKQAGNYALDTVVSFFFPHICLASLRIQRLLNCLRYCKKKGRHRQRWGLTESHTKYNILSGHFPLVTAVHTGGKMLPDQEGPISPPLCSGINSYAICRSKAHQAQCVCFGVIQEAITFCKYWGDL